MDNGVLEDAPTVKDWPTMKGESNGNDIESKK
jgi:hypothetical protein